MNNPFFSVIIVWLGIVFLIRNFGHLDDNFFNILFRYWPIGLIFLGLYIFFEKSKKHKTSLALVGFLFLIIFTMANTVPVRVSFSSIPIFKPFNLQQIAYQNKRVQINQSEYNLSQFESVEYQIKSANNRITINDSLSQNLLDLNSYQTSSDNLNIEPVLDNQILTIPIVLPNLSWNSQVKSYPSIKTLAGELEKIYDIQLGRGVIDLNLNQSVNVNGKVDVGLGSILVDVSESTASGTINLNLGTGSVNLVISDNVAINYSVGLGTVIINGQRVGAGPGINGQISGASQSANLLNIDAQVGLGNINISQSKKQL